MSYWFSRIPPPPCPAPRGGLQAHSGSVPPLLGGLKLGMGEAWFRKDRDTEPGWSLAGPKLHLNPILKAKLRGKQPLRLLQPRHANLGVGGCSLAPSPTQLQKASP